MSDSRKRKIEGELQRALAGLVSREVKDPRVGNVTITHVDVAPDLKTARVFFVPFASSHDVAEVQAGLAHAAGFLRGEAGRRLGLRYAPRLEFVFDERIDEADRLTRLIDRAVQSGPHPADDTRGKPRD
jgi:ribosome-binding factor A